MLIYVYTDVDECSSEPMRCVGEATCSNTEGSFICQCPFGYIGDGRSNGNGCTGELCINYSYIPQLIKSIFNIQLNVTRCARSLSKNTALCYGMLKSARSKKILRGAKKWDISALATSIVSIIGYSNYICVASRGKLAIMAP